MKKLYALGALAALGLTACALNPVVTPYAFKGAANAQPQGLATVWGIADGTQMYFREVDGKGLPSRRGGGYPISLSLLPGAYTVEIYFLNWDHRDTVIDLPLLAWLGGTLAPGRNLFPAGGAATGYALAAGIFLVVKWVAVPRADDEVA